MKRLHSALLLLSLLNLGGCGQFQTHRSYLSEMGHDDSSFYSPENDFPVMAGDTGRWWTSENDRRARTPASEEDVKRGRHERSLEAELHRLESQQSEDSFAFYQKYRDKMSSTSERIYFLQLPSFERADYIQYKGLAEVSSSVYSAFESRQAIRQADILLGMSKDDVLESWGRPARVEVAGNPSFENERWLYSTNGATKYIYFEAGRVEGWE
jgi:hypothetical protein